MRVRTLLDIRPGETGAVRELFMDISAEKRMLDLGFIGGAPVSLALVSPLGDPRAYRVAGAVIALRNADARRVTLLTERGTRA